MSESDDSVARSFVTVQVVTWVLWLAGLAAFAFFFERMGTVGVMLAAVALGLFMPSWRDLPVLFRPKAEIARHAREKQARVQRRLGKGPPGA
jgi:hypothetical protein